MMRLLCLLGFHRWRDVTSDEAYGFAWTEQCDRCKHKRSGWTFS